MKQSVDDRNKSVLNGEKLMIEMKEKRRKSQFCASEKNVESRFLSMREKFSFLSISYSFLFLPKSIIFSFLPSLIYLIPSFLSSSLMFLLIIFQMVQRSSLSFCFMIKLLFQNEMIYKTSSSSSLSLKMILSRFLIKLTIFYLKNLHNLRLKTFTSESN